MQLKITDNVLEMIEIGKEIVRKKANIYKPQMVSTINQTIDNFTVGGDNRTL